MLPANVPCYHLLTSSWKYGRIFCKLKNLWSIFCVYERNYINLYTFIFAVLLLYILFFCCCWVVVVRRKNERERETFMLNKYLIFFGVWNTYLFQITCTNKHTYTTSAAAMNTTQQGMCEGCVFIFLYEWQMKCTRFMKSTDNCITNIYFYRYGIQNINIYTYLYKLYNGDVWLDRHCTTWSTCFVYFLKLSWKEIYILGIKECDCIGASGW